jgi:hypothetical protein
MQLEEAEYRKPMKRCEEKLRGIFEKPLGSGKWLIRYVDSQGAIGAKKLGRGAWLSKGIRQDGSAEGRTRPCWTQHASGTQG